MDLIQEVGSYAGFAAVVGLAVLAALFFSQARDLRRLREWAGRAPERAAGQTAAQVILPEQAAQEATRPAPSGAVRPIPAAKPAAGATPAAAAGAGAAPATAVQPGGKPATPAATPGKPPAVPAKPGTVPGAAPVPATAAANAGQPGPGKAAAAGTPAKPGGAAKPEGGPGAAKQPTAGPAPATPAGAPVQQKGAAPPPAAPPVPGATTPAAGAPAPAPAGPPRPPVLPARPGPAPVGRTPAPGSQSTAVLPASSRLRDRPGSGGRRSGLDARYIALIVAGVIVVGAGAAFGVSQLGGDDEPQTRSEQAREDLENPGPINRSLVTVSVLNGTTVPGLAAQIGDEIESRGFQRGNVANAIDQQRPDSVVLFAEGAERPARIVARNLDIAQVEPVDPDSQALAGNASVVVIVGADQTQ